MKRNKVKVGLLLTLIMLLFMGSRAQAGNWTVSIKGSANGSLTYYHGMNATNTQSISWSNLTMPPFLVGLAAVDPVSQTKATVALSETFTIQLMWHDVNGAPPPAHLNYLLTGT